MQRYTVTGDTGAVANGLVHRRHRPATHQLPLLPDGVVQGADVEQTLHGACLPKARGELPGAGEAAPATTPPRPALRAAKRREQEPGLCVHRALVNTGSQRESPDVQQKPWAADIGSERSDVYTENLQTRSRRVIAFLYLPHAMGSGYGKQAGLCLYRQLVNT